MLGIGVKGVGLCKTGNIVRPFFVHLIVINYKSNYNYNYNDLSTKTITITITKIIFNCNL